MSEPAAESSAAAAAAASNDSSRSDQSTSLSPNRKDGKSNYYFFQSTPAEQAAQFKPKPVDTAEVAANHVAGKQSGGTSLWNKGNTWEERDLSNWAKDTVQELLKQVPIDCAGEDSVAVDSVDVSQSHATIVFVRGKKRHGFELTASVKWTGTIRGKAVEGKINFPEIADDVDDEDFQATVSVSKQDTEHNLAKNAVRNALPGFQKALREFERLFREK